MSRSHTNWELFSVFSVTGWGLDSLGKRTVPLELLDYFIYHVTAVVVYYAVAEGYQS